MRAWTLVRDTNAAIKSPVVQSERCGREGGGASLTELGRQVLDLDRSLERDAESARREKWQKLRRLLET